MDILSLHFQTLRYFGLWSGPTIQHWLVKYIWKPFVINFILLFTISLLAATTIYHDNISDLTECIFISLTYVALCLRLLNFLCRQHAMDELLNKFRMEIFRPRNNEEIKILGRYEKMISLIFYSHMGIGLLTGLAFLSLCSLHIVGEKDELEFPLKYYEICYKENLPCFIIIYILIFFGIIIGIILNITLDILLVALILLTCGQIDLCCYRFSSSSLDEIRKFTKECVIHQILLREIVKKINSYFMRIAMPLVLFSLITMCTSIYNISQKKFDDPESLPFFMYLGSLLVQLFCYCWFGNELKNKSTAMRDIVYNSNWIELKPLDRKSLYFIMLSCETETGISMNGFCIVSIEIFVWVLKMSYAAYNLLKTVEAR